VMDQYSADALRFTLLNSPVLAGEDMSLTDKDISDNHRKLSMVWNMYDFFSLYASVDGWEWNGKLEDPYQELTNPLDQWIVSRVHQLTAEVEQNMDAYDIPGALKGVLPFIDDASNWYIRRSRKRFWKTDNDSDKDMAYQTLPYVLVRLSLLLAPFTPFMAEELYRNLTGGESVHLCDWPASGQTNGLVLNEMADIRELITRGLAQRAEAGIRVRQPLAKANLSGVNKLRPELIEIVAEELNVKKVEIEANGELSISLDTALTEELKEEGLMRELIRHIQNARKNAGLNVDDRINMSINTGSTSVKKAYDKHQEAIFTEVLSRGELSGHATYSQDVKIDGETVTINISKSE